MTRRCVPPTRMSSSSTRVRIGGGANQRASSSGSVHARQSFAGEALKNRSMRKSNAVLPSIPSTPNIEASICAQAARTGKALAQACRDDSGAEIAVHGAPPMDENDAR